MRSGGGLCTQGPSANLLHRECLFCFVFRVGVFCLLTQLKTLKTVPVQWIYKILEIGYSSLIIKAAARLSDCHVTEKSVTFPTEGPLTLCLQKEALS